MKTVPSILITLLILAGCTGNSLKVTVENNLAIDRTDETLETPFGDITSKLGDIDPAALMATDSNGTEINSQLVHCGKGEPESIIFQADVRTVLNKASEIAAPLLALLCILTVVAPDSQGGLTIRGLFAGDDIKCFRPAAAMLRELNFITVPLRLKKVVVWLDPHEVKSTWMGNKSVYRMRMAIADGHHTSQEVESAGNSFGGIYSLITRYNPKNLQTGIHLTSGGKEFCFITNPAAGLWKPAGSGPEENTR